MAKSKKQREKLLKILRFSIILLCLGGFLYQSFGFMFIYWTYPTVVSIQKSEPRTFEMPAFTFCNTIGYNYTTICKGFPPPAKPCLPSTFNKYMAKETCGSLRFGSMCYDGKIPSNFQLVRYQSFKDQVHIKSEDHDRLRTTLESYFSCEIEFDGQKRPCNTENVLSSLYSTEDLPQYCYSIYSLWGKPDKKRERVQKGTIMRFKFFLNASMSSETDFEKIRPRHNTPAQQAVQIAVHSPYTLPSPFLEGTEYLGGRSYDMRIKMNRNVLLPAPYQTNCTNYFGMWLKRGGKAPMNQMGMINECRLKKYMDILGCVPLNLDYPHKVAICPGCKECNNTVYDVDCAELSNHYNQPCLSTSYSVTQTEKMITIPFKTKSEKLKILRRAELKVPYYICNQVSFVWSVECSTVDVQVLFDNFEVTSLRYNPKYESMEIFSVIGGYLGMWLGISLVTVNDFIDILVEFVLAYQKKMKKKLFRHDRPVKVRKRRNDFKEVILSVEDLE